MLVSIDHLGPIEKTYNLHTAIDLLSEYFCGPLQIVPLGLPCSQVKGKGGRIFFLGDLCLFLKKFSLDLLDLKERIFQLAK